MWSSRGGDPRLLSFGCTATKAHEAEALTLCVMGKEAPGLARKRKYTARGGTPRSPRVGQDSFQVGQTPGRCAAKHNGAVVAETTVPELVLHSWSLNGGIHS